MGNQENAADLFKTASYWQAETICNAIMKYIHGELNFDLAASILFECDLNAFDIDVLEKFFKDNRDHFTEKQVAEYGAKMLTLHKDVIKKILSIFLRKLLLWQFLRICSAVMAGKKMRADMALDIIRSIDFGDGTYNSRKIIKQEIIEPPVKIFLKNNSADAVERVQDYQNRDSSSIRSSSRLSSNGDQNSSEAGHKRTYRHHMNSSESDDDENDDDDDDD